MLHYREMCEKTCSMWMVKNKNHKCIMSKGVQCTLQYNSAESLQIGPHKRLTCPKESDIIFYNFNNFAKENTQSS